jgi:hypothetical protein
LKLGLCNGTCEIPPGIPDQSAIATPLPYGGCEIAVALQNNIEAYASRTSNQTFQTQDCLDSLGNITQKCIQNGPNAGSVAGPDDNELFQSGFRVLNAPGSHHSASGRNFTSGAGLSIGCPDTPPLCSTCQQVQPGEVYPDICKS